MKTSLCNPTITYEIRGLVEGGATEFFFDWIRDTCGGGLDLVFSLEGILVELFPPSLGPLEIVETEEYYSIGYVIALTDLQLINLEAVKKSLDIATEHFVTKYRLRRLVKYYEYDFKLKTDDSEGFDYRLRKRRINDYLAKRFMRTVPAYN